MRSNTYTPLLQFTNWWGLESYRANGIDRYNNITQNKSSKDSCYCMLQHPWQGGSQWSRDDLAEMLKYAELFFVQEANYFPIYNQILREAHNYTSNYGLTQKNGKLKSVRLRKPMHFKEFGVKSLDTYGVYSLVRDSNGDGTGTILDTFTVTAPILPDGTLPENVRVFFTTNDGRRAATIDIKRDREWEIRPIEVEITDNGATVSATITGGAYLFKLPELDEESTCVPHEFDTYVTEVEIFVEAIDTCDQGVFICESEGCQGFDCERSEYDACFGKRLISDEYWAVPAPLSCDEEGVRNYYCLTCLPSEVQINYINGESAENYYLNDLTFKAIALLGIGLADCIKGWCTCDYCVTDKIKYYRQVENIKIGEGVKDGAIGDQFKHFINKQMTTLVTGLPPYRGITEAFRIIQMIGAKNLSGHSN